MTHFFVDPKSGADYPFAGRLKASEYNAVLNGVRGIDSATFWQAMTFTDIQAGGTGAAFCLGVNAVAGALVSLSATDSYWRAVGVPASTAGNVTLPGSPTLSNECRCAYDGGNALVFVCNGFAYLYPKSGTMAQNAFAAITRATDVLWSEYAQQFVCCGRTATPVGRIETSADGATWALNTDANLASGYYQTMAADPTGRYILALTSGNSGSTKLAYSDDGGVTFTTYTHTADGDAVFNATTVAYDAQNSKWLAAYDTTFSGNRIRVWSCVNPAVPSWTAEGVDVPSIKGDTPTGIYDIEVFGSEWIVGAAGASNGNVWISNDSGATWASSLGIDSTNASGGRFKIYRTGRHLVVSVGETGASTHYLSRPLWPDVI